MRQDIYQQRLVEGHRRFSAMVTILLRRWTEGAFNEVLMGEVDSLAVEDAWATSVAAAITIAKIFEACPDKWPEFALAIEKITTEFEQTDDLR